MDIDPKTRITCALLAASACVFLAALWPAWWVRDTVLRAADFPRYQGVWKFLPHLLLYSTLPAVVAAIAWIGFSRKGVLEPVPLGKGHRSASSALIVGLATIVLVLVVLVAMGKGAAIGWKQPDPWSIAGNVFSNFYEELIYRGFLLAALAAVFGFWPAAVLTSALWAATHTQYPVSLQVAIFVTGLMLAWAAKAARTLWAPWGAHMTFDVVLDSLV